MRQPRRKHDHHTEHPASSDQRRRGSHARRHLVLAGDGILRLGHNYNDLDGARIRSLSECANHGGNHCVFLAWSKNGCAALAVNGGNYYGWYGANRWEAGQGALQRNGGGHIHVSQCAT